MNDYSELCSSTEVYRTNSSRFIGSQFLGRVHPRSMILYNDCDPVGCTFSPEGLQVGGQQINLLQQVSIGRYKMRSYPWFSTPRTVGIRVACWCYGLTTAPDRYDIRMCWCLDVITRLGTRRYLAPKLSHSPDGRNFFFRMPKLVTWSCTLTESAGSLAMTESSLPTKMIRMCCIYQAGVLEATCLLRPQLKALSVPVSTIHFGVNHQKCRVVYLKRRVCLLLWSWNDFCPPIFPKNLDTEFTAFSGGNRKAYAPSWCLWRASASKDDPPPLSGESEARGDIVSERCYDLMTSTVHLFQTTVWAEKLMDGR